jgi:hypothetical protein
MTKKERDAKAVDELRRLVDWTVDKIIARGERVTKSWAVEAVRKHTPRPKDSHAWYWLRCEGIAIDVLVGAAIRDRREVEGNPNVPDHLLLPGSERLQKSYSVLDEDGEWTLVPISEMTPREVEAKKAEFRRGIAGLSAHLEEFTRYHDDRLAVGAP